MSAIYYSFWLVPQEPDLAYFQDLINTLAKQFGTVSFSPHVTLYSGFLPSSLSVETVLASLSSSTPMELEVVNLNHESRFSKTLYVQLKQAFWLAQLVNDLVSAMPNVPPPQLDPHLSLLYHRLEAVTKQNLIETIVLPRTTMRFNQIQAIAAPENFETQAHVMSLRCVHSQLLTTTS